MFKTRISPQDRKTAPPGRGEKETYVLSTDEDGRKKLKQIGKTNTYAKIQSYKEETLVYNILDKFEKGDSTVLQKAIGQYINTIGMPKTLAEANQLIIDAKAVFNELPSEQRALFDNDPNIFIANYGTEKFNNIFIKKENKNEKETEPAKTEPAKEEADK